MILNGNDDGVFFLDFTDLPLGGVTVTNDDYWIKNAGLELDG